MRRRQFLILTAGIELAGRPVAAGAPQNFVMGKTPKPVPDLKFQDAQENELTPAAFKGKVVLLNIWASWCVPCRTEMPALDRLEAALGSADFEIVPVSIDRLGMNKVSEFYAKVGVQHPERYVASDANGALTELGVFGIPTSLLIDRNGQEIARLIGPAEWDSIAVVTFLTEIIAQQKEIVTQQKEVTP